MHILGPSHVDEAIVTPDAWRFGVRYRRDRLSGRKPEFGSVQRTARPFNGTSVYRPKATPSVATIPTTARA
jgi:hypothetical protein